MGKMKGRRDCETVVREAPPTLPEYPAQDNPFENKRAGKPGRPKRDELTREQDEALNQRQISRTFIVPLELVATAEQDAASWGFTLHTAYQLACGRMLMIWRKAKGPLVRRTDQVSTVRE